MTTQILAFDDDRLGSSGCLFPQKITEDPWIAFHGTSGVFEDDIAREGLHYRGSLYSQIDIHTLLSVFKDMNWAGRHAEGFPVLSTFTLNDFAGRDSKPIFLGEFSVRSALYARADWAGGETARGIRHAIAGLEEFLGDPGVRQAHLERQRAQCIQLVRKNGLPSPVIRVDLDWLRARLASLEELRRRAEQPRLSHRFGVVYAVMFDEESAAIVEHDGAAGYWTYEHIPPSRIVAALRVTDDQAARACTHNGDERWSEFQFARRGRAGGPSLLATVAQTRRTPGRQSGHAPPVRPQHVRDSLAGIDEALAITAEYGTEAVRAELEAQPSLRNDSILLL